MVVVNRETHVLILGDGMREKNGRKPGQGTVLIPNTPVALEDVPDVPKGRRDRFVACVRTQIAKGRNLQILAEKPPEERLTSGQLEELRTRENLNLLKELAPAPAPEPAPEPPKRGPGRPRKNPPLGG